MINLDSIIKDGFIEKKLNTNVNLCWHCLTCTGGCPFSQAMDYNPNQVIRLVQLRQMETVLSCSAIWICVGCHTCSIQCPNNIDIPSMMDSLCQEALSRNIKPTEPDILNFHNEVLRSVKRYGRTHKMEIMLRYKLIKRNFTEDINVGLKMIAKRKLDMKPSKVTHIETIKQLFEQKEGSSS